MNKVCAGFEGFLNSLKCNPDFGATLRRSRSPDDNTCHNPNPLYTFVDVTILHTQHHDRILMFQANHLRSQATVAQRALISIIPCSTFHRSRTSHVQLPPVWHHAVSTQRCKCLTPYWGLRRLTISHMPSLLNPTSGHTTRILPCYLYRGPTGISLEGLLSQTFVPTLTVVELHWDLLQLLGWHLSCRGKVTECFTNNILLLSFLDIDSVLTL